jgi:hypothetical protein
LFLTRIKKCENDDKNDSDWFFHGIWFSKGL